ncbi:MAG TPA: hypothetical protein VIT20_04885 [Propionibacteriaceae bacterium]
MLEPSFGVELDSAELVRVIADAVRTVPGVVRLEPTLSTVGLRGLYRDRDTDGVQLVNRSGLVEADINVATTTTHQARAVAEAIRTAVNGVIGSAGYAASTTTVNVLTIEVGVSA